MRRSRSIRARVVLAAGVPVAVALVVAVVAVGLLFARGQLRDLDAQTRAESDTLVALVSSGQLPSVLPVPAGSLLLAQVLDADGAVLASTVGASRVQPLASAVAAPGVSTDEQGSYLGVPLRLRVAAVAERTVVVAAPLEGLRRVLSALRTVLLVVVPLLLLATTAVVWRVTGLALAPVERLRRSADELARSPRTDGARLPVPAGADEIARLGRTLNALLERLQAMGLQRERFVADAAHELRSPLASLRVQLDVARAHPDGLDTPALLEDLAAEVERLATLTDDLLTLSRLDAGPPLHAVLLDLRELAGASGEPAPVRGDPVALARLVDNLRTNAARHATAVVLSTSVAGTDVLLDVDDDGPGIAVADRQRVFDRWVRLDQARGRGEGGSGLGLALVREIARLHGGDAEITGSPLGGARVRVRLPRA